MYSSVEVAKYLTVSHEQLIRWIDAYYEEFHNDNNYKIEIAKHIRKDKSVFYMLGHNEISGFGSMIKGERGLKFLKDIQDGKLGCDIDKFLEIKTKLEQAIRDTVTVKRLEEGYSNDGRYYMHYVKLIHQHCKINTSIFKLGGADSTAKNNKLREEKVADKIYEYSDRLHYKDVFKQIKLDFETGEIFKA